MIQMYMHSNTWANLCILIGNPTVLCSPSAVGEHRVVGLVRFHCPAYPPPSHLGESNGTSEYTLQSIGNRPFNWPTESLSLSTLPSIFGLQRANGTDGGYGNVVLGISISRALFFPARWLGMRVGEERGERIWYVEKQTRHRSQLSI